MRLRGTPCGSGYSKRWLATTAQMAPCPVAVLARTSLSREQHPYRQPREHEETIPGVRLQPHQEAKNESPSDPFMSVNLEDRTPNTRSLGAYPSRSFHEALSRAAYAIPATPPSMREQVATFARRQKRSFDNGVDDADDYSPSPKRRASERPKAVVVVPRTPVANRPRQPNASTRTPASKSPRVPTLLNNGKVVNLTKWQAEKRTTRSEPVDKYRAHPPMKGLLFRVWEEDPACDRDSRQGHTARKYWRKNAVPNDPPSALDPTDVLNHMDREMVDSPFISTCSRLVWTVQLMPKYLTVGKTSCRVSIINAAALDRRSVFHARPYSIMMT